MLKEFKEFAMRGNVIDMAIGIIIGGAFGKIITSFVNDIIMPPIGLLLGKMDFANMAIVLSQDPEVKIKYGTFVNVLLDFIIVAFVIFLLVRQINRMKAQPAPAALTTKDCPYCVSAIPMKATRCPNCTAELKG